MTLAARSALRWKALLGLVLALFAATAAQAQLGNWSWERDHDTDDEQRVSETALDTVNRWVYAVGFYQESSNQVFGLPASVGNSDAYLAKFDYDGNLLWSVRLGSSGNDMANAVAVDQITGRVYVTGSYRGTLSTTVVSSTAPSTLSSTGGADVFVACYTPAGACVYLSKAGGVNDDTATGIAVNTSGVFVTGHYIRSIQFSGAPSITPTAGTLDNNQHLFVANYPLDNGNPRWVINAANGQTSVMGKCVADADNVYLTGSFNNSTLPWTSSTGTPLLTMNPGTTRQHVFTLAVSNAGSITWGTTFVNPNSTTGAGRGIALGCGLVYVTGQTGNGTTFPGAGSITDASSGGSNYLFLAALKKTNGQAFSVKPAYSANYNGSIYGTDISVTPSGLVYLTGVFRQDIRFGTFGVQITVDQQRDIFIASFTSYLQPNWIHAISDPADEDPTGIAATADRAIFLCGYYQEDLELTPFVLDNDDAPAGLFLGRVNDTEPSFYPLDPSRWHAPAAPICANSGPVDLSTGLRAATKGNATAVTAFDAGTSSQSAATGAANASGALITGNNASITLDLGLALNAGDRVYITWMENPDLAAALGTATMQVEESYDNVSWTVNPTLLTHQVNLLAPAYTISGINLTSDARYLRLRRISTAITSNLNIDALTYRTANVLGGTWSGTGVTPAGVFSPTGLSGAIPITYTVDLGTCSYSTTHSVNVTPSPGGGLFTTTAPICPNTSAGDITISGYSGSIVRWESSTDGFVNSTIIPSTAGTITTPIMSQNTRYRVLLNAGTCGNAYSNVTAVTVQDLMPPVLLCPHDTTIYALADRCSAPLNYAMPVASDNCTAVVPVGAVDPAYSPGAFFPTGSTVVQLVATDDAMNAATCAFTITVLDTVAPHINCPGNIAVNTDAGACGARVTYALATATDNCAPVTVTNVNAAQVSGSFFPVGTTVVRLRATDNSGNSALCAFTITVTDAQAPVLNCSSDLVANAAPGSCAAIVSYVVPSAGDNCGIASLTRIAGPASGSSFPVGVTTVTYQAVDVNGASATCSFTVTIHDSEAPVITCPADIMVNAQAGLCGAQVTYTAPVATDNCSGWTVSRTSGPASGSFFPVGTTSVVHQVTDATGHTSSCAFQVTVQDLEPPALSCPGNITVNATSGQCGAVVNYSTPVGTDNCSGVSTVRTLGLASGSFFPVGITNVIHKASDLAGNTITCAFTVEVIDAEAPVITCPSNITVSAASGLCSEVVPYSTPVGVDNCSGITIALTNGLPTGSSFPVGTTVVTYKVIDNTGLSTTCSFNVTVTDNTAPTITCPGNITVPAQPGTCGAVVTYAAPIGTDACAGTTTVRTTGPASGSTFPVGSTVVTHRVADSAGLTNECSFTVTVTDAQTPVITCPANIAISVEPGLCGAHVSYSLPAATDNCTATPVVQNVNNAQASGSLFPVGTTIVQLRATDAAGNSSLCSFTITVADTIAPAIAPMSDITVNAEPGACSAHVSYVMPSATDNCPGSVTVTCVDPAHVSGSAFPVGNTTVRLKAVDITGNASELTFIIHVIDVEAPVVACPSDLTVMTEAGQCGAHVNYALPLATDNCAAAVAVSNTDAAQAPGSLFPVGSTLVQLKAVDAAGNASTCSFRITVKDTLAPVMASVNDTVVSAVAGLCGAYVDYALPSATDNCGGPITVAPVLAAQAPGSFFPIGSTAVQLAASDTSGATSFRSFTITVTDTEAPSLTCPTDTVLQAETGRCGALLNYALPTASDNCSPTVVVVPDEPAQVPGTTFPVGTTAVVLRATDASGNNAYCSFAVTVIDTIRPVFSAPANITTAVEAGACGAHVNYALPTASDNCSASLSTAPVNTAFSPGSLFPVGTTTVALRATDAAGNSAVRSFTITVTDTIAPVFTAPADMVLMADNGACSAQANYPMPIAADNCGGTISVAPVNSAHTSGALFPVGTTSVVLRATDAAGNRTEHAFTVTVIDTVPPALICPGDITTGLDANSCDAHVSYVLPSATDLCSGVIAAVPADAGQAPGSAFPLGTSTVQLGAMDASGNTGTCAFRITVVDDAAPVVFCPLPDPVIFYLDASCQVVLPDTTDAITVSDCSSYTVTQVPAPGTVFTSAQEVPMVMYITDAAGNTYENHDNLSIRDTIAPAITCPSDTTVNANGASCGSTVNYAGPVGSDNCSSAVTTQVNGLPSGALFPAGTTVNTYRVQDASGNQRSCSFTVTVIDNAAPVITCPSNLTVNTDAGACSAIVSYPLNAASDNCSGTVPVFAVDAQQAPGGTFTQGIHTVQLRATDVGGNSSMCAFAITVIDATAPSIICPGDMQVDVEIGQCGAHVNYTLPSASDNCTGPVAVTNVNSAQAPGSFFPVGTTPVQLRATDSAGNSTLCTFNVIVRDTAAPVITCPANIDLPSEAGLCGAHVSYTLPVATDLCDGSVNTSNVNAAHASGAFFPVGTTMVSLRATDLANNSSTCSFAVTVIDQNAPVLPAMSNLTAYATAGSCGAPVGFVLPDASDECGSNVTVGVVNAAHATGSIFPVGTTIVHVRATDAAGNSADGSFSITVIDTIAPVLTCPGAITAYADPVLCGTNVTYTLPVATDACGGSLNAQPVTTTMAPGSFFPVGNTTVRLRATDAHGNVGECTFPVSVVDTIAPDITCPPDVHVDAAPDACGALAQYVLSTATDNCATNVPVVLADASELSGSFFPVGTTDVALNATDTAGNTAECIFHIVVADTTAPTLVCPADTTVNAPAGVCSVPLVYALPVATDACAANLLATPIVTTQAPGSLFPLGLTTVDLRVSDAAGNSSSCAFHVNVIAAPATLSYPSSTVCGSESAFAPGTALPIGGTFSADAGLTIDPSTGVVDATQSSAGTYTARYFSTGDCPAEASFAITIVPPAQAGGDGSITLCAADAPVALIDHLSGSPALNGSWSGPAALVNGVFDPASMPGGTYTYTVAGASPCPNASADVAVTLIPVHDASFDLNGIDHCMAEGDLLPSVHEAGGVFSATAGVDIDPATGLVRMATSAIGTHLITYTIGGACGAVHSAALTIHALPVADAGEDRTVCGTSTTLDASGSGTWIIPSGIGIDDVNAPDANVVASAPGTYVLRWAVSNGPCLDTTSVSIHFADAPLAAAGADQHVCGLNTTLAANGTGTWSGPAEVHFTDVNDPNTSVSADAPGSYTLTWAVGTTPCTAADEVMIRFDALVEALAGDDEQVCGLSAQLNANGSGHWSTDASGIHFVDASSAQSGVSADAPGSYALVWSVSNGACSASDTVTIGFFAPAVAEAGENMAICGYTTNLNASGTGYWSSTPGAMIDDVNDPTSAVSVQAQGSYTFTWNVVNGPCAAADEVSIQFYTPVSSAAGPDRSMCSTSTTMEAVGTGTWDSAAGGLIIADPTDPHTLVSALSPGTYYLNWTLVNGTCVGTDEVAITFHPLVVANAGPDQEICGMDAQLAAQGNGSWSLPAGLSLTSSNAASATVHADAEGTYALQWTASNGLCSSVDTVQLIFHAPVTVSAGTDVEECGTSVVLDASGPGAWTVPAGAHVDVPTDAHTTLSADAPGTYELAWTAVNGTCMASDTVRVTFLVQPDASFSYITTQLCSAGDDGIAHPVVPGGVFSADVVGLVIDPATGTIDVSASALGTYNVIYALGGVCPSQSTTSITISATADASWTAPAPLCQAADPIALSILLTTGAPGGTWSGPGVTGGQFDPAGLSGEISLTYTTGAGACLASEAHSLQVDAMPVSDAGPDQHLCTLSTVLEATLDAGSGTWSGPADALFADLHDPHTLVSVADSGIHTFTWTVQRGTCQRSTDVTVRFFDPNTPLWARAGDDQDMDIRTHTELSGEVIPGAAAQWSVLAGSGTFGDMSAASTTVTDLGLGDNLLLLTASLGGCISVSDTMLVHVNDVFIPQGFSPDGDGVNETFEITGVAEFPDNTVEVFDRWGKRVFDARGYNNEWDGRGLSGAALPNGTYFYLIQLTPERTYQGYVVIKR